MLKTSENQEQKKCFVKKKRKDLISLKDLELKEIQSILDRGDHWSDHLNSRFSIIPRTVDNPIVSNLFFESSTRTRFSFEVAAKKLGFHVLNFEPQNSSVQKGETLYDTLRTLESMGTNAAIIRTSEENILQEVAPLLELAVINAGAGANEHPTQGLLDILTMRQHFGKLNGLKVAIIGDIKHSRVANSNIIALAKFNAKVFLAGPENLLPSENSELLGSHTEIVDVDDAVKEADVVMMLRLQRERHALSNVADNYFRDYGLSQKRFSLMQNHAMIMHPAPFNRGVEIDGDLVEHPRSLIYKQVSNGVAIRMAVLERAL
jgi:aspartate carbamoyltransferase catalytic subunit